jgi:triosephosphate isomerase
VGHSERRQYHDESDELINKKVLNALASGVIPILCVGEPLEVRKAGEHVPHTLAQLDGALAGLTAEQVKTIVVAYEPVWAIGTGETATPEDAQELCEAIRSRIAELYDAETADAVRVLYGGSVKSSNVASIMAKPDVDGALVGGASLDPDEFAAIARYQSHASGL